MNEPYDIIQTASLTEKSTLLSEKQNKYVFRVSPRANKIQIKNAIERLFQKKVVGQHLQLYRQKKARTPRRLRAQGTLEKGDRDSRGRRKDRFGMNTEPEVMECRSDGVVDSSSITSFFVP